MSIIGAVMNRFGWICLLAGPIFPLMQLYDAVTCAPAAAKVTAVETRCHVRACRRCDERPVRCDASAETEGSYAGIERTRYARISFKTADGRQVNAMPTFGKLNLTDPKPGDPIAIIYRTTHPTYVAPPYRLMETLGGLGVMAFGGMMLMFVRRAA
jgi:hypothetical protein